MVALSSVLPLTYVGCLYLLSEGARANYRSQILISLIVLNLLIYLLPLMGVPPGPLLLFLLFSPVPYLTAVLFMEDDEISNWLLILTMVLAALLIFPVYLTHLSYLYSMCG
jgi:hypothetical protein